MNLWVLPDDKKQKKTGLLDDKNRKKVEISSDFRAFVTLWMTQVDGKTGTVFFHESNSVVMVQLRDILVEICNLFLTSSLLALLDEGARDKMSIFKVFAN